MKIVYLSTAKIPSRTANGIHIMKMCSAMATNGHNVTLIAPQTDRDSEALDESIFSFYDVPQNFKLIRVFKPSGRYGEYCYAFFVLLTLMFKDVDVFFSRNPLSSFFTSWKRGLQILELHQPIPATSIIQACMFKVYTRRRNFGNLVVITQPLKEIFTSNHLIHPSKIIVAPDGADIKQVLSRGERRTRLQVGYLGHLYEGRGVEIILDLAEHCGWADFHIVGGTERDIQRVKVQVQGMKNVEIHGFVPPSQAGRLRSEMDVLLAPYQRKVGLGSGSLTTEKWMSPLKVFEYMAEGKALICSDIEVLHEVLESGVNCLMCPPDKPKAWVSALTKLNEDRELRDSLGGQALKDIRLKYSWQIRAETIIRTVTCD
jgi:glycosyltransferase involved in cell wall biosynthesis